MITIHRMPQWDILSGGIPKPAIVDRVAIVIGWQTSTGSQTPDHYARLFCLWSGGVWVRLWGRRRLCLVWRR